VQTKHLQKFFEQGESVRIIAGLHAGGSGTITNVITDKYAVVSMDGTKAELRILLANLNTNS
jgi:transcription antitermination factor NusG